MSQSTTPTLLLVEDDPAIRCLLTLILDGENYNVVTAEDGQDALDQLRTLEPDAILLDMMLPKVDGFEVIQALSRAHEHIPIVALSAGNRRPTVGEQDVHAFLSKPYNVDTLLLVLEDVLAAPKASTSTV
jgi:CheY-like chemotaxis protein